MEERVTIKFTLLVLHTSYQKPHLLPPTPSKLSHTNALVANFENPHPDPK